MSTRTDDNNRNEKKATIYNIKTETHGQFQSWLLHTMVEQDGEGGYEGGIRQADPVGG